jgi:AcrR family transcriptional regulator
VGISERRERERTEVRRKILDAAQELFAAEGHDRITMRRIADAIEYSPTTIYLHFEDKDDLIHCLCQENFENLIAEMGAAGTTPDPLERLRRMGMGYARFGLEHPNHYRFMFLTPFGGDHQPSPAGQQAYQLLRQEVANAIAAGLFKGSDVDTVSQVMWSSLHGAVSLLITYGRDKFPCAPAAPDLVEQVMSNTMRGLLAEPTAQASRPRATSKAARTRKRR